MSALQASASHVLCNQGRRAPLRFALAPGCHISRRWRFGPTFAFRAWRCGPTFAFPVFGAQLTTLDTLLI
jgi:hypothetical protein